MQVRGRGPRVPPHVVQGFLRRPAAAPPAAWTAAAAGVSGNAACHPDALSRCSALREPLQGRQQVAALHVRTGRRKPPGRGPPPGSPGRSPRWPPGSAPAPPGACCSDPELGLRRLRQHGDGREALRQRVVDFPGHPLPLGQGAACLLRNIELMAGGVQFGQQLGPQFTLLNDLRDPESDHAACHERRHELRRNAVNLGPGQPPEVF